MILESLPFLLRLLWDPVRALDLLDAKGAPDYAKVIPVTVIYAILVLAAFGKALGLGVVVALLAASFGQSMFRSFLKSKTVTVHEQATFAGAMQYARTHQTTEQITRTIEERRDHTLGIEPTDD